MSAGSIDFTALLRRLASRRVLDAEPAHLVAFDLLATHDRQDLQALPYRERRARLEELLAGTTGALRLVPRSMTGPTPSAGCSYKPWPMVAEFEANIGHLHTREGMAKARRQDKLRGKQPKLPPSAARAIRRRYADGEVSLADLAEEYSVGRSTIHRIIHRPEPDSHAPQV
jgi:hypothetical protein